VNDAPVAPPPPPVEPTSKIKPGIGWYWVAGAVLVLGVSIAIGIGVASVTNVFNRIGDLQKIAIPGRATIHISKPQGKVIYFEGRGRPGPQSLGVTVTDPDGQDVSLSPYFGDAHYHISNNRGVAIATFDASKVGDYSVRASRGGSNVGSIAIGNSVFGGFLGGLLGAIALAILSGLVALLIVIIVAIRRRSARRRMRGEYQWDPQARV
jgi:hypothetical protein